LEPEQVQDSLDRDLGANPVEVDAGHGCSSLADAAAWCSGTVPFPFNSIGGTGTILLNGLVEALPSSGRAAEPAGSLQRLQHHAQARVLDRKAVAELGARPHRAVGQKIKDLLLETASPFRLEPRNNLPVGRLRVDPGQLQIDRRRRRRRRRTVLTGAHQRVLGLAEIQVRAPSKDRASPRNRHRMAWAPPKDMVPLKDRHRLAGQVAPDPDHVKDDTVASATQSRSVIE
jgi:hypothetical protein